MPLGADSTRVTWRSLLALGISGGLLPCPSALVVMLGAIALDRLVFGLVLIVVFSMGLASTLTTIGIVMVHAKGLLERFNSNHSGLNRFGLNRSVIRVLPAISSLFIVVAGAGITLAALTQAGLIHL
jgi:nickel/cobalt exporter